MGLTWLLEATAILLGGALNAGAMIGLTSGITVNSLGSAVSYLAGGVASYLFASIVYGIISPTHAIFSKHSAPWKDAKKASPVAIGMIVVGGIVNGILFGLLSASPMGGSDTTKMAWNWLVGILGFFGVQLFGYLGNLVSGAA